MRRTGLAAAAVLVAATPGAAQNGDPARGWEQVVACAKETTDARRHACIDAVLAQAGVLAGAEERRTASVEEQRRTFGLSPAQQQDAERRSTQAQAQPAPAAAPGPAQPTQPAASARAPALPPAQVAAVPPPPPRTPPAAPTRGEREDVDSIVTTVSRAFDPGNRRLVIVTADNQIWQQADSKDLGLPPRAGTAFSIEQGALGSFTCRIGTARGFRCRRQG